MAVQIDLVFSDYRSGIVWFDYRKAIVMEIFIGLHVLTLVIEGIWILCMTVI